MSDLAAVCGVDLGGTKIEARLFDTNLTSLTSRQVETPQSSYGDLLEAVVAAVDWALEQSGEAEVPVGIGLPGLIDPRSGLALTSNIPATGKPLAKDIAQRVGQYVVTENDGKCFALSEANGGAADDHRTMLGLVLGTGLGGGICRDGRLAPGLNRIAGEIGHIALPAHVVQRYHLPIMDCGCGRQGCFETLLSGRGIQRIDNHLHGANRDARELVTAGIKDVFQVWYALLGELLHMVQLALDPDCVVLGGGLSNLPSVDLRAADALKSVTLPGQTEPAVKAARFGANSGSRGAALLALQDHEERQVHDA